MTKKVIGLMLVILFALSGTGVAVNWVFVAREPNVDYFIDSESISSAAGNIIFWSAKFFHQPAADQVKTAYVKFETRLTAPGMTRQLSLRTMNSQKQEISNRPAPQEWREVPPGSPLEQSIKAAVAFSRTGQASTLESDGSLRFYYAFQAESQAGPYIRILNGTVKDPRGLWQALVPLQPPPGARGGYGLLGDDGLLKQEPGFGLRQLGRIARQYLSVDSMYVRQPSGFADIGAQAGVFIKMEALNDTTLGWVFFDLRPKFEDDLKKFLKMSL